MAELKIATDLLERGHRIAIPFGEDWDFDLVLYRDGNLERVQIKHATSDGHVVAVKCGSHSLTNGRVRRTKRYTAAMIDWLAVYDVTTDRCFYIGSEHLGDGRSIMCLRLTPALNGQRRRINDASAFEDLGPGDSR